MKLSEGRRKDFQWLCGLLAFVLLGITLGLYAAFYLTSRSVAVEATAVGIASMFSPRGLDEEGDIAQVKAQLKAGQVLQPVPGLPVRLTADDIQDKSPREIRLMITRQIAAPIYDGEEAIEKFTGQEFTREELMKQYGVLIFLSRDTHRFLQKIFLIVLSPTLLILTALVLLSRRWGKLVSVALVVGTAVLPWATLTAALWIISGHVTETDGPIPGLSGRFAALVQNVVPPLALGLLRAYGILLILTLVLLVIAGLGKITTRQKAKT